MVPRYRGDGDDWLDDEEKENTRKSKSAAKPKIKRPPQPDLKPDEANATVIEAPPKLGKVLMDDGRVLLCSYRRANLIPPGREEEFRERSPLCVGDRVQVEEPSTGSGVIDALAKRINVLTRASPSRHGTVVHHLAANLDAVVIVASTHEPDFSPGLVDRFLVACHSQKIPALLCITKSDLRTPREEGLWEVYRAIGIPIFFTTVKPKVEGIEELIQELSGKTVVFCGHSGVGKTSLLRKLLSQDDLGRVGALSESTGKGQHTTTSAQLYLGAGGGRWIDTPGVREFGLHGIPREVLISYFPEMARLQCEDQFCAHIEEEGCAIRDLPRFASYRRIYDSLEE